MLDKIKRIKRSRLKPEELFLMDILNEITITVQDKKGWYCWEKDGKIIFKHDDIGRKLYCSKKYIWVVMFNEFGYCYSDAKYFIRDMTMKYKGLFLDILQ